MVTKKGMVRDLIKHALKVIVKNDKMIKLYVMRYILIRQVY